MKEALRDVNNQAYISIPMRGLLTIENMINNYQFHNKLFFLIYYLLALLKYLKFNSYCKYEQNYLIFYFFLS